MDDAARLAETARVKREDPAPFAWLDDSTAFRGSMPIGFTIGSGVFFLVVYGICVFVNPQELSATTFLAPSPFLLLGAVVVWMGLSRRAWRRRHPGIDPVAASTMADGGPFTDTRLRGSVFRWICIVACFAFALFALLVVIAALTMPGHQLGERVGTILIALLLGTPMALIGVSGVAIQRMPTDRDRRLGLGGSMFGGASRAGTVFRWLLLVPVVLAGLGSILLSVFRVLQPVSRPGTVPAVAVLLGLGAICAAITTFDLHRVLVVHHHRAAASIKG